MSERDSNLAEVIPLDKYRRTAYNSKVVEALVRLELWKFKPHEFMVFMYLLTHTLFLGKDRITVPMRLLEEGVFSNERGQWAQVPVPLCKRTLLKVFKGLQELGFIEVVRNKVLPGFGMVNAANTIIIQTDAIKRVVAAFEAIDGTCIVYPDEGFIPAPVVSSTKQPD